MSALRAVYQQAARRCGERDCGRDQQAGQALHERRLVGEQRA
jgi:hypothetical protein